MNAIDWPSEETSGLEAHAPPCALRTKSFVRGAGGFCPVASTTRMACDRFPCVRFCSAEYTMLVPSGRNFGGLTLRYFCRVTRLSCGPSDFIAYKSQSSQVQPPMLYGRCR